MLVGVLPELESDGNHMYIHLVENILEYFGGLLIVFHTTFVAYTTRKLC